jgi:hypothetical protein
MPGDNLSMERKMMKLTVCVFAGALSAAATVAVAETAPTSNARGIATPAAADPAVRASVMATVERGLRASQQQSGQRAARGSLIGRTVAATAAKTQAPAK